MQALDRRPHCVESAATRSSGHCLGIIKRPSRELVLMILGKLDEPLSLRISCSLVSNGNYTWCCKRVGEGGLEAPSIFFFSVSNKVIKNANNLLIATIF